MSVGPSPQTVVHVSPGRNGVVAQDVDAVVVGEIREDHGQRLLRAVAHAEAAPDRAPLAAGAREGEHGLRAGVLALTAAIEPLDVDEVHLRRVHRRPVVLQLQAALPLRHLFHGGRERSRRGLCERAAGRRGRTRSPAAGPTAVSARRPSVAART